MSPMKGKESTTSNADGLAAIGALAERTRRAVYDFVAGSADWVSRDEVAEATRLERGTASHHLERLIKDGLLKADYRRLGGRTGRGAGRPAKLYRRADRDISVSLPQREYELAGRLLAAAADRSRVDGVDITTALAEVAGDAGRRIADDIAVRHPLRAGDDAIMEALAEHGFEPRREEGGMVVLSNCPFHKLAQEHPELICGMNLCLLSAAVEGIDESGLVAKFDPRLGRCCVTLGQQGDEPPKAESARSMGDG